MTEVSRGRESSARFDECPVSDRIRLFRRRLWSSGAILVFLVLVNALTTDFPWVLIPAVILLADLIGKAGSLWSDGVSWREIFGSVRPGAASLPAKRRHTLALPESSALAPPDVLAGRHGGAVRRAAADRDVILEIVSRLDAAERALLPEIAPTVHSLAERVGTLALSLHRLDEGLGSARPADVDARIARLEREPATPERERLADLLGRQRLAIEDLLRRRTTLRERLESALLALENLRLDLLRFRSAGVHSALHDVASATQEARALSRDIGYVLEAAGDAREI